MKPIKFESNWGSMEIEGFTPISGQEPRIFFTFKGPRGGAERNDYLSAVEALALAEYLRAWALEILK